MKDSMLVVLQFDFINQVLVLVNGIRLWEEKKR